MLGARHAFCAHAESWGTAPRTGSQPETASDRPKPTPIHSGFDDRRPSGKPAVLRRKTTWLAAILGFAAILYGAFAPFQFDLTRPLIWEPPWHSPSPGDAMANVLIYIPIGGFLRLILRRRGSCRLREYGLSLSLAAGLSYFTEVGQSLLPVRVSTWSDVFLNVAGAVIGIMFAPWAQHQLRTLHAELFARMRSVPVSMAAAVLTVCLSAFALSPPDFYPSMRHVERAWHHFAATTARTAEWAPALSALAEGRVQIQVVDKFMAGSAYGLLAFILVMAMREAGNGRGASCWHALSRSMSLAAALELAQAFTLSHVADPRDLAWAWICSGIGTAVGGLAARWSADLHRRPLALLRGMVASIAVGLLVWMTATIHAVQAAPRSPRTSWLPMIGNFDRSWNGLLGDYVTGLLQYTLIAGLVLLWYRSRSRWPNPAWIVAVTAGCALAVGAGSVLRYRLFDTAQILLAIVGAVVAIRLHAAVFGRRIGAGDSRTVS